MAASTEANSSKTSMFSSAAAAAATATTTTTTTTTTAASTAATGKAPPSKPLTKTATKAPNKVPSCPKDYKEQLPERERNSPLPSSSKQLSKFFFNQYQSTITFYCFNFVVHY